MIAGGDGAEPVVAGRRRAARRRCHAARELDFGTRRWPAGRRLGRPPDSYRSMGWWWWWLRLASTSGTSSSSSSTTTTSAPWPGASLVSARPDPSPIRLDSRTRATRPDPPGPARPGSTRPDLTSTLPPFLPPRSGLLRSLAPLGLRLTLPLPPTTRRRPDSTCRTAAGCTPGGGSSGCGSWPASPRARAGPSRAQCTVARHCRARSDPTRPDSTRLDPTRLDSTRLDPA